MPESTKDRPTNAIEYIFLLSKSQKYFYNHEAVKLPASLDTHARYRRGRSENHKYSDGGPGDQTIARTMAHMADKRISVPDSFHGSVPGRKDGPGQDRRSQNNRCPRPTGWNDGPTEDDKIGRYRPPGVHPKSAPAGQGIKSNDSFEASCKDIVDTRARRNSDWFFESWQGLLTNAGGDPLVMVVNSRGYSGSHFATFPEAMVEPCIKAGSRPGDIVLDPFVGSGTTVKVAERLQRVGIGIDLAYQDLQKERVRNNQVEMCL